VLIESRLSLGLVIDIDIMTDVEFEQVDHKFDLELDWEVHLDLELAHGPQSTYWPRSRSNAY
jgi:hypothetical protein